MSTAARISRQVGLMCDAPDAVAAWLRERGEPVVGEVSIARVGFGQSNITTVVSAQDGHEWVLREPPPGDRAESAHDVAREAHIVTSLAHSDIPVPRVIGTGKTPAGNAFFVMERVAGSALESEADAGALSAGQRRELGLEVIDTLARLHTLDPATVGLSDLARPSSTPYVGRQIRRLTAAWEHMGQQTPHHRLWDSVRARLAASLPADAPTVLIHGDFRLSNLLVQDCRISAVLDWELCTLGDPLADLAWLLDDWRQPADEVISMPSPTRAGGFPERSELLEVYCRETGLNADRIAYYRGFSQWRAATLLQGVAARRRSGLLGTHGQLDLDQLDSTIATLINAAAAELETV
ncbi:phosphotransferase family protein [Mycolicibacterium komossense]|nr:phosphotransferase family protein [Mycolicibacterium komossense]